MFSTIYKFIRRNGKSVNEMVGLLNPFAQPFYPSTVAVYHNHFVHPHFLEKKFKIGLVDYEDAPVEGYEGEGVTVLSRRVDLKMMVMWY